MDLYMVKSLAEKVAETLRPVLPLLLAGGTEAATALGSAVAEDAWVLAKQVWNKIRPASASTPALQAAAADVAEDPADADNLASLRKELRKVLERNPDLAEDLASLFNQKGPSIIQHNTTNDRYDVSIENSSDITQRIGPRFGVATHEPD